MGRAPVNRSIPIVLHLICLIIFNHVTRSVISISGEVFHLIVDPAIGITTVPFAIRFWHTGVGKIFFREESVLIDINLRHLDSDCPKNKHEYDGRHDLKAGADVRATPQNKVLAHERSEMTNTLRHD